MSKQVDRFFSEYIYRWMFEDVEKMIKIGCNYPAALCISVYCEVLGKLFQQDFSIGNNRTKFQAFLPFLGKKYIDVDNEMKKAEDSLYSRLRCGLVHDYLLKQEDVISTRGHEGVYYDPVKNSLFIGLDVLFNDFKNGAKQLHRTMLSAGKIIPKDLVSGSGEIILYKSGNPFQPKKNLVNK